MLLVTAMARERWSSAWASGRTARSAERGCLGITATLLGDEAGFETGERVTEMMRQDGMGGRLIETILQRPLCDQQPCYIYRWMELLHLRSRQRRRRYGICLLLRHLIFMECFTRRTFNLSALSLVKVLRVASVYFCSNTTPYFDGRCSACYCVLLAGLSFSTSSLASK